MLRRSTKRNLRKNRGPKSSNCIEPRNCIEPLESRVLLSTITWINSSGGSWNTASNWSGGVTPGSGDDVVINQPGNISITISASTAAHSLQLTGDTLVVSAGTLSLGADSAVNSGATLSETGGNVSVTGSLINTGTISIAPPSQLTISGTFTQNGTLSMAPGALISGVGQNLLGNPDFESPAVGNSTTTNPNNWGNWGTSVANKQFAFTGAQSLVESNGNSGVNQSFSVTPGISYILSAYAMTPSTNKLTGPQGAFLNLFFFDASGNQLSASTGITALNANSAAGGPLTGSVGGQGWNFFSVSAVAPSNAVRATVALQAGPYTGISGTGGGLVYWDNAQFGPQAHTSAVVSAAGVTNNGSITIGAGDTINSSGTFAQTSTGILNTQLGGPAASLLYGSVTATGAATLGGILNATLTNGYSPSVNDGFHILTYQGETGTFAGYGLPTGGSYKFVGAVGPMDTGIGAIPLAPSATVSVGTVLGSAPPAVVGVNLAWWDSKLTTTQTQQMVTAAGLNMFRFPGGSSSDDYHFNVSANFGDGIANTIPQFAQFIQAVGGTGLVTTDYGSGSPQEAEAELAYLLGSPTDTTSIGTGIEWNDSANQWQNVNWQTVGYWASLRAATPLATDDGLNFLRINHAAIFLNVTYWEIGNEEYGSWEVDHHGTSGPGGVSTGAQHDPATYAKFALAFANFVAADQANFPILRIGIDSGDPTGAGDNNWTRNVITQGAAIGFVPGFISDHSYMQGPGSESDSFLLNNTVSNPASTLDWSVRYADYKAMLTTIDGSAAAANTLVMATEYNSNYGVEGKQMVSIVNGLFVADSIGSLLDSGYQAGLFWDLRNGWTTSGNNSPTLYGWRQGGDEGILGDPNNTSIAPSTGPYVPYPNYFAEQLASKIAQSGGKVLSVTSSYNEMAVYSVLEPNGHLDLMVINKNPDADIAEQFNISGFNASGQGAQVWRYGEAEDFAQSQTTTGAASLTNFTTNLTISGGNFSYLFPAYSMTVIDLAPALTVATAAAATPNPVTGTSTALSALGAENGTDAGLTYTWSTISAPGGVAAPVFSSNGTNSSKNTAATLFGVGNYTFLVTITDSSSNGVTSSVNVTVNQTLSSIVVSPGTVTMNQSGSQQFSATALDQFAKPMSSQPAFTWSLQGGSAGGITAGGLYSATAGVSGTAIVIATSGAVQGTAAIVDSAAVSSYTWQNAAIGAGGFVDGIFYSPNQPNVIYARTDIGGLYKTTNDGASWQQLLDFVGSSTGTSGNGTQMQEIGVLSFAIDPENPNNLYAMAGEYSGTNGAVFYSTNGGQTWGQTNLSFYVGGNSNGRATGERIAVDPYDSNIVFMGTNANGLWESTNSGHSFTQVTTFPSAGNSGINFVYFNPYGGTANSPTQNIFVGVNSTVAGTNLYRTTNGGTSWTEITGTGSAPNAWMPNRAALASDGNLYVAYSNGLAPNSSLTNGGVFRFNITSGVWTNISPDVPQVTNGTSDQFGYVGLALDPENPSTVVVTSFDRYAFGDAIWRTTNANAATPTWTALFQFQGYGGFNTTRNTSNAPWVAAFGDGISNWAGSVAINPFNSAQIMYGTGQGIWATNNGTSATTLTAANSWYFPDNGIEFTAVGGVAVATSGVPLYSAMGDILGFAHSTLTSSPALGAAAFYGSGNSVDVAANNPNVAVIVGSISVSGGNQNGVYTTNGGQTFSPFPTNPGGGTNYGQDTVAVSADGSSIVWSTSGQAPFFSTNFGTSWTASSGGMPVNGRVISDRVTAGDFYYRVGASVYFSSNGGASFVLETSSGPTGGNMAANPFVAGDLWIAANNGVYHSTNFGATFTKVGSAFSSTNGVIALGAAAPGSSTPAMYVFGTIGGFLGIYRSDDAGLTWTLLNDISHQWGGLVQTMAADPKVFGRIYLGINGRGIIFGNPANNLPSNWVDADINAPGNPGWAASSTQLSNGTTFNRWSVVGGGAGIGGTSDQFNFAYRTLSGNGTISAQLTGLTNSDGSNGTPQAGVMFRAGANSGDAFVALLQSGGNQLVLESRASSGGSVTTTSLGTVPLGAEYLELARSGSNFTAFTSTDGVSWAQVGSTVSIAAMPATANAGLAVTANYNSQIAGATFANVSVSIGSALTVAQAAAANPNPAIGTTTALSALGSENGSDAGLIYTWSTTLAPNGVAAPTFSANGTNAAKNSTATLFGAGSYTFLVTITDPSNASVTSSVSVTVNQTLTSITVSPSSQTMNENGTQQFTATAFDQFGTALASQPAITWTLQAGGVGGISGTGLYSATPGTSGSATVIATSGAVHGNAMVTVNNATPTVSQAAAANPSPVTGTSTTLSVLGADDGGAANLSYSWTYTGPTGATFSANGTNAAHNTTATFTQAGTYNFTVTITDSGGKTVTSAVSVTVNQTASSVAVSPASIPMNENGSQQFSATAFDQFGNALATQPAFTWTLQAGSVGSINATGLYSATPGTSGLATVVANISGSSIKGTATVTVNNATPTVAIAASATSNPAAGTSTALSVLGADDGGESNLTYAWSYTGPAGATFSANGTNASKNSTATFMQAGTYNFTVTITDSGGKSVTSGVSVTVNQTATSVAVGPASITMNENGSQQFSATAFDQFGNALASQPAFTWTLGAGSVGTLSASGLYSATPGTPGSATVTANISGSSIQGSATVTVNNAAPTVAIAASATPNPATGTSTALSVLGADDGGESNLTYTWSYTGPTGAAFSANGTNASKNATATFTQAGTYNFTVTIKDSGGLSTTSAVSVAVNQTLTSIAVGPASITMNENGSQQFTATAKDQFGNALASQPAITWTLQAGSVGGISGTGLYSATPGTSGTATVIATSGAVHGNASVTVNNGTPTVATPASATPNPATGASTALSVLGADDGGESNLIYTWSYTGPSGATFSANGTNASKNSTATFTQAGTYNFTVTIKDSGGLSTTSTVGVTVNQTLTSITVSPSSQTMNENGTQQFTATAFDQFGNALASQPTITWSLQAGSVGGISGTGLYSATPGTSGSATVIATSGAVHGNATVTVNNATPTVATAASATPNPATGMSTALSVLGADDGGESNLTYTWSYTGPTGAAFSANGTNASKNATATFTQAGTYNFTVTIADSGGKSTTSGVSVVVNQTLTSIVVNPGSITMSESGSQQFTATAFDQFGTALASQPAIVWSLQAGSVGGISAGGLYSATPGTPGTATVIATSGAVHGNASVTVSNGVPTVAQAAAANPSPVAGTTTALSVLGADDGGEANLTYTWSASGPAAVSFSANGTNGSKNSTATFTQAGSYQFTVTITDATNLSTTSSVNVMVNQTATSVAVSPTPITMNENGSEQFSATAFDQFGNALASQPAFVWSLGAGSVGSVNASGLYSATPGTSGSATVTANIGGTSVNGSATVTVNNAAPTVATAASATPSPATGMSTALIVLGADDGGESGLTYTWSYTGPAGATFSANGTNASKNSTASFTQIGTYSFTVTIKDSGGLSTTSTVSVTVNQTLTSILVSPASQTMNENGSQQFSATALDQFGTALASQPAITWSLGAGSVGGISATGLYSATPGTSGSATVIATSGAVHGNATVTVNNAAPTVATAASATPNPVTGTTTALSVLGADDGGESNLTYQWASSGPAAVAFNANGTNASKNVTATFAQSGTYNFTVTIKDSGGSSVTSGVSVTVNQTLTSIAVSPASTTVAASGTQPFTASAKDQFGNALAAQPAFTWSLGTGSVGSISLAGLYTAPATAGSATVIASAGGIQGTASVTVTAGTGLPAGWSDLNIGAPGRTGTATVSGGTWTVSGGGADIWNASDQFNYAYESVSGNFTAVADVTSVSNTDPWAKAGLMIRNGTAANAAFVDVVVTPGNGVALQWRTTAGGTPQNVNIGGITAPRWVKLSKIGNSIVASYSSNGTAWTQIGSAITLTLTTPTVGLAVTAHNNSLLATATFTNVSVTSTSLTQLTGTVIGTAGSYQNQGNTIANVFDGNLNTFFDAPTANGDWAGLDLGSAQTINAVAFAPRSGFAGRMVGGMIQVSNTADFSSGVVTILTIGNAPATGSLTTQAVSVSGQYRYIRYLSPNGGWGNIAELQVFT